MTDTTTTPRGELRPATGMDRISVGLWVAVLAAVLQLSSVASDFYEVGDSVRDAWFGVPHTADLIAISGLTTLVLLAFVAAGRSPVRGRTAGWLIAGVGLVATLQVAYRMAVPPFGGCLTYTCGATPNNPDIGLLVGIWIALAGCVIAVIGGVLHALSSRARATEANFWVADEQPGVTPALGTAALGMAGAFLVGYTVLDFYTVQQGDTTAGWSAWLSAPHTSTLVLLLAIASVILVVAASRRRAPMSPQALGATIAVLAFVAAVRTGYRMLVSPFFSGPAEGVFEEGVVINLPAFVALALALIAMAAGIAHAARHRQTGSADNGAVVTA